MEPPEAAAVGAHLPATANPTSAPVEVPRLGGVYEERRVGRSVGGRSSRAALGGAGRLGRLGREDPVGVRPETKTSRTRDARGPDPWDLMDKEVVLLPQVDHQEI